MVDILPAILSQTKADLMKKMESVPSASAWHIDLMDGKFVGNQTIGPAELDALPKDRQIEFHLMVRNPAEWMEQLPDGKNSVFLVHVEVVSSETQLKQLLMLAQKKHGKLALVLNPPTPLEKLEKMLAAHPEIGQVLLMTVNPGWAGQKYNAEMEEKIRELRQHHPSLVIEVDGGVGMETAPSAIRAGANRLAAANAIFKAPNPSAAFRELERLASTASKADERSVPHTKN